MAMAVSSAAVWSKLEWDFPLPPTPETIRSVLALCARTIATKRISWAMRLLSCDTFNRNVRAFPPSVSLLIHHKSERLTRRLSFLFLTPIFSLVDNTCNRFYQDLAGRLESSEIFALQEEPWLTKEAVEQNALALASVDAAQDPILQNDLQLKKAVADSFGPRTVVCKDGESIESKIRAGRQQNKEKRQGASGNASSVGVVSEGGMKNVRFVRNKLSAKPLTGRPGKLQNTRKTPPPFAAAQPANRHPAFYDLVSPQQPLQQPPFQQAALPPQALWNSFQHPAPPQLQAYAQPPPNVASLRTPQAQRPSTVGPETAMQVKQVQDHLLTKSITGEALTSEEKAVMRAMSSDDHPNHPKIHGTLRQLRSLKIEAGPEKVTKTLGELYGDESK